MNDTGYALESLAMRSSEAATGTPMTTQACSTSTTTGLTTTTTMSASADPTLQHLDAGHAATEGSILVESIPQNTAKARQQAKPKTAVVPTGATVERGNVHFSSNTDLWATPQAFFDKYNSIYQFTTDVCALTENAKVQHFYSPEEDGLSQQWQGVCWMNPPYGRDIIKWMKKAYESSIQGGGNGSMPCTFKNRYCLVAYLCNAWRNYLYSGAFKIWKFKEFSAFSFCHCGV